MKLEVTQRQQLLAVARQAIAEGLATGLAWLPELNDFPGGLSEPAASFVTLSKDGELRGCRGMLEPVRPLIQDVAHNAFMTAFDDPRFPPVDALEFVDLSVEISVLSILTELDVANERALLAVLRPGLDGLVLQDGFERATFLPKVWDKLPEPEVFLKQLKWKAGWPADYWTDTLKIYRYTTDTFGDG